MNNYELLYLVPATKSEEELAGVIKLVEGFLAKIKADVVHHKLWEQKRLEYTIKRVENAYFVLGYFNAEPENVPELTRLLGLEQDVLRSVVVKHTPAMFDAQVKRFVEGIKPEERSKQRAAEAAKPLPTVTGPLPEETQEQSAFAKATADVADAPVVKKEVVEEEKTEVKEEKKEKDSQTKDEKSPVDLDKKLEDILGGDIEI